MRMSVRGLIEALRHFPEDLPVILQRDAEGNGYSPCLGAAGGLYEDAGDEAVPCVVLWPNG